MLLDDERTCLSFAASKSKQDSGKPSSMTV